MSVKVKITKSEKPKSKTALADEKRGYAYLTTRILVSNTKKAGQAAAQKAMETMGYLIVAKEGWLVKIFKNGDVERIEEL